MKVIDLIINGTKNKTVIIISHDDEIIPYSDKVINLNNINYK
jgi:ABC-type lipoprotein export system ATPase subunit